jgi:hypothetical protein
MDDPGARRRQARCKRRPHNDSGMLFPWKVLVQMTWAGASRTAGLDVVMRAISPRASGGAPGVSGSCREPSPPQRPPWLATARRPAGVSRTPGEGGWRLFSWAARVSDWRRHSTPAAFGAAPLGHLARFEARREVCGTAGMPYSNSPISFATADDVGRSMKHWYCCRRSSVMPHLSWPAAGEATTCLGRRVEVLR